MDSKEEKLDKELRQARYEGQDAAAQGVEPKDEAPGIFKNNEYVRLRNKGRREATENEKVELAYDKEDDEGQENIDDVIEKNLDNIIEKLSKDGPGEVAVALVMLEERAVKDENGEREIKDPRPKGRSIRRSDGEPFSCNRELDIGLADAGA